MNLDAVVDDAIEKIREDRGLIQDGAALLHALLGYGVQPAEIASRAYHICKEEMRTLRNVERAQGAALLANTLFSALGDEPSSLRAGFDFGQIRFMIAEKPQEYLSQSRQMIRLCVRADELKLKDLAFDAALAAADCVFFASESEQDPGQRDVYMYEAVRDLVGICQVMASGDYRPPPGSISLERFAGLVAAAYAQLRDRTYTYPQPFFSGEVAQFNDDTAAILQRLAACVEQVVPDTFSLPHNRVKSALITRSLADLSRAFGDGIKARNRLLIGEMND